MRFLIPAFMTLVLMVGTAAAPVHAVACVGDCNGSGTVTVDELIRGVNIVLGTATRDDCPSFDADNSHTVTVNELIIAVTNALSGCPVVPTATPTPSPTPSRTVIVLGPTPTMTPPPSATPTVPSPTPVTPSLTPTRDPNAPAPDPAGIAPPLSKNTITDLGGATSFLYDPPPGQPAVQVGVVPGTIDARRAAVIRGHVVDQSMAPLAGVAVRILGHSEFGRTSTPWVQPVVATLPS